MTAAIKDRNTIKAQNPRLRRVPVQANVKIFAGTLVVAATDGYAEPGTAATGKRILGVSQEYVDNTGGADGDKFVHVESGVFGFVNDGADALAQADIDNDVYITDDITVCKTSTGKSKAGKLAFIEGTTVFVDTSR